MWIKLKRWLFKTYYLNVDEFVLVDWGIEGLKENEHIKAYYYDVNYKLLYLRTEKFFTILYEFKKEDFAEIKKYKFDSILINRKVQLGNIKNIKIPKEIKQHYEEN